MNRLRVKQSLSFSLLVGIFVFIVIYFVRVYQYAFNYQILFNENYRLSLYTCSFLLIYLISFFATGKISYYSVLGTLFLSGILTYSYHYPNREFICILSCALTLFFICGSIALKYLKSIFYIFFSLFIYNTSICFYSIIDKGAINGIINNYGIVGIYSAINLSFLLFLIRKSFENKESSMKSNVIANCIFVSLLIIGLMTMIVIIKSKSRTAIVISVVAILLFAVKHFKLRKGTLGKLLVAGMVISMLLLFAASISIAISPLKQRSLSGRFFMVKIALYHLYDNIWFGTGIGRFTWYYPKWQAEYFKNIAITSGLPTGNYAGESYIVFNELLQTFLTVGVIGFFLISLIFVRAFRTKSNRFDTFIYATQCTIACILISGLASYPFHVNLIMMFLMFCLGILFRLSDRKLEILSSLHKSRKLNVINLISLTLATSVCAFLGYKNYLKVQQVTLWHSIKGGNYTVEQRKALYKEVSFHLRSDGKFLADYGDFLIESNPNDALEAIEILQSAERSFISKELVENLGYAYYLRKDYKNAIICFEWVQNYLPYLFEPKLMLMKIYLQIGNYKKSQELGIWLLRTSPRIANPEIEMIKKEANSLLIKYKLDSS